MDALSHSCHCCCSTEEGLNVVYFSRSLREKVAEASVTSPVWKPAVGGQRLEIQSQ